MRVLSTPGKSFVASGEDFVLTAASRCVRSRYPKLTGEKAMATKQARGTKRTCQSNECGARFYDLNRDPITCPICGSIYALASSPLAISAVEEKSSRRGRKSDYAEKVPAEAADAEADEALPEIEDGDAEVAAEEDETFLEEEEEEGGDVSNIIGGPVDGGDEER
jgi:uncharacterized protein (TIGR02300 family)